MVSSEIKEARWWVARAVRLEKEGRPIGAERALMNAAVALVQAADVLRDEVIA